VTKAPLHHLSTTVVENHHLVDLRRELLEGKEETYLQIMSYGEGRPPLIKAGSSIDIRDVDVLGASSGGLQGDRVRNCRRYRGLDAFGIGNIPNPGSINTLRKWVGVTASDHCPTPAALPVFLLLFEPSCCLHAAIAYKRKTLQG
jgi:hypothetical protein